MAVPWFGGLDKIILVVIGIILLFYGKRTARFVSSFLFGLLLGIFGFNFISGKAGFILGTLAGLILFFIGITIGFFVFRVALSFIAGLFLSNTILMLIGPRYGEAYITSLIILVIILTSLTYALFEWILVIGTSLTGSIIIFSVLVDFFGPLLSLLLVAIVFSVSVVYQSKREGKEKEASKSSFWS